MAVKTTKIQCNQDVDLRGKVDVEGKVTCGSDVEVDGKLQINSASDLKTKDGSSFGGGIEFYEIDMGTDKSHTITEEQFNNAKGKNIKAIYNNKEWYFYYQSTLEKSEYGVIICLYSASFGLNLDTFNQSLYIGQLLKTGTTYIFGIASFVYPTGIKLGSDTSDKLILSLSSDDESKAYVATINGFPVISSASQEDIKVQSTLYRHTVTIWNNNNASLIFTAESEKNTPIDSIQDLVTVFGNTKLACSGMKWESASSIIHIMRLDVGTSISDTNVYTAGSEDGSFGEETFSDILGATGLIITDTVTAM